MVVAKRKEAAEALSKIEKDFNAFRLKYVKAMHHSKQPANIVRHAEEQLRQVEREIELLEQSNCLHPDFVAQMRCVDERRNQKVKHEDTLLQYNMQALGVKTVAERQQLHSQYFQDVRQLRDDSFDSCYKELYALQRDRRNFFTEPTDPMLYNPNRAEQIRIHTNINHEISLLAGIAKHVGFPAAPEMSALLKNDAQLDLQSMGVSYPPSTSPPNIN